MKAGTLVAPEDPVVLTGPPRRFVSRGGEKLEAALVRFEVDVTNALALDAGASTGGFTDCLLRRGAARVAAVDVGYGQLDWRLREDPRVTVMERTNVRDLEPGQLPFVPGLVTADLSFISLRLALPALRRCTTPGATFMLLVKPQFEAGRDRVGGGGVVSDPEVWLDVLGGAAEASRSNDIRPLQVMASPLKGPAGNVEFLLHGLAGAAGGPGLDESALRAAVDEGRILRGQP